VSVSSNNGDWTMRWSDGFDRVDVKARGAIVFADDLSDIQSIAEGGYFTIRDRSAFSDHTVDIRPAGGTLTRKYSVGGAVRPWDDEARKWFAAVLPRLVRRSGLAAESRVNSIFQKKGVSGVLDEIGLLEGDYVRRIYFVALVDAARLDSNAALPVLAQVGQRMSSDYDRGQVLQHIAGHVKLDQRGAQAYVQAMAAMKSDYERRRSLTALLTSGAPAAQTEATIAAIAAMRSSYDKRMVLSELMSRGPLSIDTKKAVLDTTSNIQSDYDRGQILLAYVQAYGVESAVRDPFFAAVKKMSSDFERRRVITAVAAKGTISAEVQTAAFDAVQAMRSDYDRAESLLAFLNARAVGSSTRAAFVTAAEGIRSQHDQNRVLAALVRSEGR
jgi:hypothetical protein